jgi:RNase P/RNase MRP subunit p29
MNMKYLLTAISLFVLTSCGGGGGGGGAPAGGAPAASNFNGVAVDGYLYQARAFLDLNGNGQYDNGEPTATTDANGGFTLSATQDQINSHSVVVTAIAGTTIDQDNPNTPLTSGMTLVAPAGNPSVVSPLTTQVSAKMAGGLSLADAKSSVQTELGLANIDVMKNFVAEKATNAAYADAHKVAASVAEVLKNIETQSSANTTLANRFSSLTTTVTSQVAPNVTQIKAAASVDDAKTVMTATISQSVNIYSIGGSISGLTASGLVLANGVGTVSPSSGANSFTFSSRRASGASYAVTVQSNPTGQVCTVSNGAGSVGSQSITNVSVSCSNTPGALGGTISGLTTSGLVLKNGSDELTVTSGSSTFQFSSTVADAATYSVTVKTQPTGKTCSVSSGSGTMVSAGITNVQVTCSSNSYSISGSISGLTTAGLKLKNGAEVLTVSSGATTFGFSNSVAYGGTYSVSIDTQPTGHTCSLSNSSGTMGAVNLSAVQVTCSINAYSLSGSISGLNASGLKLKNGSEVLTISSGATTFAFSTNIAFGGSYSVSVDVQPNGLSCLVSNASGTMQTNSVSNISISCETLTPLLTLPPTQNPQPLRTVVSVDVQINKNGRGYWVVTQNSQTPTVEQLIEGKNADGTAAEISGNSEMLAGVTKAFSASPLLYNTSYKLFFVATGAFGASNATEITTSTFNAAPAVITDITNSFVDTPEYSTGYYSPWKNLETSQALVVTVGSRSYVLRSDLRGKVTTYSGQYATHTNKDVDLLGSDQGIPLDGIGIQAIFGNVNYMCYHSNSSSLFILDGDQSSGNLLIRQVNLETLQVTSKKTISLASYGSNARAYGNSVACTEKMLFLGLGRSLVRYDLSSGNLTTLRSWGAGVSVLPTIDATKVLVTVNWLGSTDGRYTISVP